MLYSSHEFVPFNCDNPFRALQATLHSFVHNDGAHAGSHRRPYEVKLQSQYFLHQEDYPFRPIQLENIPRYFFMSACEAHKARSPLSLDWAEFGERRQFTAQQVVTKAMLPMQASPGVFIYKYAYYVHLRIDKAWKVPVLYGRSPPKPDKSATPSEKGLYALFLMLLFRPRN